MQEKRAPALKVTPKVGTAVMFLTGIPSDPAEKTGGIDFSLFHTGCPVDPSAVKFTIQKFGERPPEVRVRYVLLASANCNRNAIEMPYCFEGFY